MSNHRFANSGRVVGAAAIAVMAVAVVFVVYGGDPWNMSQASSPGKFTQLLILISPAILCAIVAHLVVRRWFLASLVSALVFTVLVQIFGFVSLGYLEPFFVVAIFTGAITGFAVAAVVGLPFLVFRSAQTPK
ncbi:MAG: hypothetical protein AB1705_27435 [Verrucomicrobiota bacterium]